MCLLLLLSLYASLPLCILNLHDLYGKGRDKSPHGKNHHQIGNVVKSKSLPGPDRSYERVEVVRTNDSLVRTNDFTWLKRAIAKFLISSLLLHG